MTRAHGIDVSHHHRVLDWDALEGAGLNIFGAKITNGLGIDRAGDDHIEGARAHPFDLVVYYHFPTAKSSAVAQADHFVGQVLGGLRPNERLALDIERDRRGTDDPSDDWVPPLAFLEQFVREVVRLVPDRRPLVYTSSRVWRDELGGPFWPSAVVTDLWAPRYKSGAAEPALPTDRTGVPIWPRWTLWQDAEDYQCPGVDGRCDHSVFRGTPEELRAYVAIAPA